MLIAKRLVACLALFLHFAVMAQPPVVSEKTRENLMVVVRESIGANRAADEFVPTGKGKVKLQDGKEIEFEPAWWNFIGDTHIRFVFDGPQTMTSAMPQDLERLGIKGVDDALALAIRNLKRVYGEPKASPWSGGLMSVEGQSPDLNSSYLLDRAYWQGLLKAHPEGVVVCVPKRGGLLYVPLSDARAVDGLRRSVSYLYTSSERLRVSSALFLFQDGKWSVFQAPIKQ